jgi:hypothetical protein
VIPISDADRSDALDLRQSRRQPADGPRAADFDEERYDPLSWQLVLGTMLAIQQALNHARHHSPRPPARRR